MSNEMATTLLRIGTACFISPRVLLTCGHSVFMNPVRSEDETRRGWVHSIRVMPGRNGSDLPFGSAISSRFHTAHGWTRNAIPEYDYAAIVLDSGDDLGSRTGRFGLGSYSDKTLRSARLNLSGYPGDKGNGAEQWYMAGGVAQVSPRQIFYTIDTAGGQSGSAVYRIAGGQRRIVRVHAYGVGRNQRANAATRVTKGRFDLVNSWIRRNP